MTRVPPRILVAESEPLIRMMIVDTLKEAGYEVLAAPDGSGALELLDDPDNVDLVVTAIMLAGADGIEIAWHAHTDGHAVPVMEALRAAVEELLDQRAGQSR
jgi:two-component system OmpR family response regulator